MKLLKKYQNYFFNDNFVKKVKIEDNDYIKGILERSNYLLKGEIIFTDSMDMETSFIPYKIDNYKWKTTPNGDLEWCFMLSRHGFILDLAISYILTGNEEYLLKWKNLVFYFIEEEGEPNKDNKTCWRPLDAGLRLSFWVRSLVYLGKESFSEIEWQILLDSIETHKKYLDNSFVAKYYLSNWGVLALSGVVLAILFEENSTANYIKIWERLKTTIELQFSENGIQWEQSPLYHHEVILNYAYILQISETLEIKLPLNLREVLEKFVTAAYYMCDQRDYLLALNDSDYVDFSYVYDFYRGMGLLNDKKSIKLENMKSKILLGDYYFKKITSYKKKKYEDNFFDSMGGLAVLKDDNYYLSCFNGLHGSSHGQSSQGSITLNYKGKPILIDCGRYSYTECEKRMSLNSDFSHNTVTLENLKGTVIKGSWEYERLLEPLGMYTKNEENFSFIEMNWLAEDNDKMAVFRRNVLLFKDIKTLVIVDDIKMNHNDTSEVYFHLNNKVESEKLDKNTIKIDDILIYSDADITTYTHYHSHRYNTLDEHTAIKVTGDKFVTSIISLDTDLKIERIPVYQNNQKEEFKECKGVKLILGGKKKEIYINSSEIVKHDKLLVGDNGHIFYGSVVVFEDNNRIRVK